MKLFKIRNKEGLYSTGGINPRFNKEGKTWTQKGLNAHLTLLEKEIEYHNKYYAGKPAWDDSINPTKYWKDYYDGCEIVTFEEVSNEPLDRELFIRAL